MTSKTWLPLNSNDPAANAAIAVALIMAAFIVVAAGAVILLPAIAILGIAKAVHWYANRPTPTDQLYAQAEQRGITANFPESDKYIEAFIDRFWEAVEGKPPTYQLYLAIAQLAKAMYEHEHLVHPIPPVSPSNVIEEGRYRDQLIAYQKKTQDAPRTLEVFNNAVTRSFLDFTASLPAMAQAATEEIEDEEIKPLATFALADILSDAGRSIQALIIPYFSAEVLDLYLFQDLRAQLQSNTDKAPCLPADFKGPTRDAVATYLFGTPFESLFDVPIPFSIPETTRFSGHWIIAPPGRGKTTLLHSMVKDDLEKDASIVLMDSKGDLIEPVKNLAAIKDRLLLIEPNPDFAFALNPLDIGNANPMHAVTLIEYIMAGLLDAKFTALQSTLFRNVVPAIIEGIPNPTLDTFKQVMVKGLPAEALAKLNPHAQEFFTNRDTGFNSKTYESTRKEVVWRLDYLLTNPVLRSMFSAAQTKLDMAKEMEAGKVIIINNSKAMLGDEGAEFFGRFFIALILRAAQQRAALPPAAKKPCFVYIDECQSVIAKDAKIPTLLDECRSQKIALILAHQRTAQLSAPVLDAVANCAIRMANSDDEAKYLSSKLRIDTEVLQALPRGTFGTFVRDLTPQGIQLKVTKSNVDTMPQMTAEELSAVRERMRSAFASPAPPPAESPAQPKTPSQPEQAAASPSPPSADPGEPSDKWGP